MSRENFAPGPASDPTDIYRYRDAIYAADMLTAALVHLDLFTRLAGKPSDHETICKDLSIASRPADVMLTLFVAMGLLQRQQGIFFVTQKAAEHLVKGSRWYLGPYYASLKDRPVCLDLLKVLQTGKPASWGSLKQEKPWTEAMTEDSFADQFTTAMDCRGFYLGPALARRLDLKGRKHLLDIAGGSGIYACCLTDFNPSLNAAVLEKPPVDRIAARLISTRGYQSRVAVLPGDMIADPLPPGFDIHLFSNVLHDWDEPTVSKLLQKSYRALEPGGMVVVHGAHINADKTGPLHVAEYSVLLMHSIEGKCYSISEMETFFNTAGFHDVNFVPTAAARSVMTALKIQN